ncbi:hypothetical protein PSHT_14326 [Puccinia striiformis]|uniref:Uncharacterized protein n=1 Tax=Puccinia striiformis TaxID=27350 RepID=A0A2S4UL92_9BASI|nr:hypothetical protein PSHT_14326 [Puccinia striiformis]
MSCKPISQRNIDLSSTQINDKLEAGPSPGASNLADLNNKLIQLQENALTTSEEAAIKNQKELLRHREELNKMQILGKQFSKQIANLEKSSRQNQKEVARHASDIKSLFKGGQSVTQRQDKIVCELKAVKVIVSDLSDPRLSMLNTAVQPQPMQPRSVPTMPTLQSYGICGNSSDNILQPLQQRLQRTTNLISRRQKHAAKCRKPKTAT